MHGLTASVAKRTDFKHPFSKQQFGIYVQQRRCHISNKDLISVIRFIEFVYFRIFLSYLLSFFKTLKLAAKTILGLTICSVTVIYLYTYKTLVVLLA